MQDGFGVLRIPHRFNLSKPNWIENILTEQKKTISFALVCERTMPTERLPLVGEFNANF
jgi:hypothetical protein